MTGPTHTAHHALPTLVSRLWTATLVSGIASVALGLLIVKWPGKWPKGAKAKVAPK